ncbi:MAG: hypothetical protein ACREA9_00225 [Pyrinomonadaceae bacterium]
MTVAELLADLDERGVKLEAAGDMVRYHPKSAVTPDLLARMTAHKAELLTFLRDIAKKVRSQIVPVDALKIGMRYRVFVSGDPRPHTAAIEKIGLSQEPDRRQRKLLVFFRNATYVRADQARFETMS